MAEDPDVPAMLAEARRRSADVFDVLARSSSRQVAVELLQQRLGVSPALARAILDQQITTLLPVDHGPPTAAEDAAEHHHNWTRRDIAREYGVPLDVVRGWARSRHFPKPIGRMGTTNIYFAGEVREWLGRTLPPLHGLGGHPE